MKERWEFAVAKTYVLRNLNMLNGGQVHIWIENGVIASIEKSEEAMPELLAGEVEIVDGAGSYVSSGWIDMHVHAVKQLEPYGDDIDEIGVKQGAATIVDAGSCGAERIAEFRKTALQAKTNVLAFLNISRIGLERVDELSNLAWLDEEMLLQAVDANRDFIVGLKARMSGSVVGENGLMPLLIARHFAAKTALPLMIHIGSAPPKIEEILEQLQEGDVVTHYMNGKANNLFDSKGNPLPELLEALERGVRLDVGHGTASFSFQAAQHAKRAGLPLHTISSDIYRGNRLNGPVYSLAHVMSKFLALGYSLEEVIRSVTVHPAEWLNRRELGRIRVGEPAHLTIFDVKEGDFSFIDSEGDVLKGNQQIEAKGVFVHGTFVKC